MKSRGVLLFAFNNERMDYVRLARFCASRINRHWGLPVSVVTDETVEDETGFDKVIKMTRTHHPNLRVYQDYKESLSFFNLDRHSAMAVTPYDQTILVDVDYLAGSDTVPKLWDNQPLLISRRAHSITGEPIPEELVRLSQTSVLMYWATLIMFDKDSSLAQYFFRQWREAKLNYKYYAQLYQFTPELFRNDFCVSIAVQRLFSGAQLAEIDLPYSIPTAFTNVEVQNLSPVTVTKVGRIFHDLHIMHKKSLLEAVCGVGEF